MYIYIYIYTYVCPQPERRWQKRADYASGCCSCASFDDGRTLRYIALQPHSTLFSFLRSAAFRPQEVRSQSIGFRHSKHTPSHSLLCTGSMRSGQLLSVRIVRRFTLRAHNLYECWITLCWCTKYLDKDQTIYHYHC